MSEARDLNELRSGEESSEAGAPQSESAGAEELRARLESADRWTRHFVSEHPLASVAAAAAAGFLVGRIAARYL